MSVHIATSTIISITIEPVPIVCTLWTPGVVSRSRFISACVVACFVCAVLSEHTLNDH